jgi:PTS system mannose-specific IID component
MGLMVVGGMAAQRIPISIPLSFTVSGQTLAVQPMLDSLMPGLVPLAIVLITYQLVRRRISMTRIVTGMFAGGLILGLLKIFKA